MQMKPAPTNESMEQSSPPASVPAAADGRDASRCFLPGYTGARSVNWFGLRVRSRHEVLVCDQLRASGFEPFCPLFVEKVKWSDRRKTKATPWFPGYVFARFSAGSRIRILNIRGVIEVLSIDQKPCPISDEIIANLRRLADSPASVLPHAYVVPGSPVRVKNGPFADCTGVVVRTKGKVRLVVSIPMLGQAVCVELDVRDIEAEKP
jgi:transcription antitermination factor NusG